MCNLSDLIKPYVVSCSDSLPKYGEHVMVIFDDNSYGFCERKRECEGVTDDYGFIDFTERKVIAWVKPCLVDIIVGCCR